MGATEKATPTHESMHAREGGGGGSGGEQREEQGGIVMYKRVDGLREATEIDGYAVSHAQSYTYTFMCSHSHIDTRTYSYVRRGFEAHNEAHSTVRWVRRPVLNPGSRNPNP